MDRHVPPGDYYLYGDDTYTSDKYNHDKLYIYLQHLFINYDILSNGGDPYLKLYLPDQYITFDSDYTGYWKVREMRPRIEVKDRYSDKELKEFIDALYEGEKEYAR